MGKTRRLLKWAMLVPGIIFAIAGFTASGIGSWSIETWGIVCLVGWAVMHHADCGSVGGRGDPWTGPPND